MKEKQEVIAKKGVRRAKDALEFATNWRRVFMDMYT